MDLTDQKKTRRAAIKSIFSAVAAAGAGLFGVSAAARANAAAGSNERLRNNPIKYPVMESIEETQGQAPLCSGATVHEGFVFIAGKGEHGEGDIKVHTEKVLDKIQAELERAGSSMEKALQVTVYLHNIRDYDAMNEVYRGRFGENPPVRTTVSCYGGIPGSSLVEMDCIAAL